MPGYAVYKGVYRRQRIHGWNPSRSGVSRVRFGPTPLKIYLPSTGAAAVSPAFDAAWEETGDADRRAMVTTRINSAMTNKSITLALAAQDALFRQYVSDTLAAQTISGAVSIQVRATEALATADAIARLTLKVVSQDGTTERATLLAFGDFGNGTEFDATTLTSNTFAFKDAVTAYTCILGDRLSLELGCNHAAAAVGVSINFGDDSSTDLTENDETETTANNPWLLFYRPVTFQSVAAGLLVGSLRLMGAGR